MTLQGTRSTETQGAPANREELLYALRYILSHQLSDTASLSFIYSHENQKAGTNGRSYHENLIGVSLTKRL